VGLSVGDKILSVNGNIIRDIIDLSFALADENICLLIEKRYGKKRTINIEKEYDQTLGVEFESAVFDKIRQCVNKCIFCFVEQMPQNLRSSLYIKDDDYRLSFLYGNFITLTNLKPKDLARIRRFNLSPLYVSVHTTNSKLRAEMMNNPKAALIMRQLKALANEGIDVHAQVVLCPGVNDGIELDDTIDNLLSLYPSVHSLAIVPVGLTMFRENSYPLSSLTEEEAQKVIAQIEKWQGISRQKTGVSFVYASDEFYLLAEEEFPVAKYYDGFPQLENGIGIARSFIDEWKKCQVKSVPEISEVVIYNIDVICGVSAEPILRDLFSKQKFPDVSVRLTAIENEFFGKNVTVSGLLTGRDILTALKKMPNIRNEVILPGIALKEGDAVFLDGMTLRELEEAIACRVKVAYTASELKHFLTNWRFF